jgi:kynurenine formamidase
VGLESAAMHARAALLLLALVCACATAPPSLDLRSADLVDLTWAFDERTLYWPSSPSGFQMQQLAHGITAGGWFYSANAICTAEHGGTHLDAPIHFDVNGTTADEIPLRKLIGPAVVIDVAAQAAADPDYLLTAADVRAWETRHGRIEDGSIVLLRTGWAARWPDRKAYFGDDTPGATDNLHFPSYGEDAARLLVIERRIGALGVDTASIDRGQSRDFMVHRIAGEANVPGFENIANLDRLPPRGAWVFALPMKIGGGSGGPLRIVAAVPR